VAGRAAERLDAVFVLDVQREDPPIEPGSLDCILYGDILEHLVDPEGVLARHRVLLDDGGIILCSVPNVQHHSILTALLRSDFQYTSQGLLDSTHLRFFTYSTFIKLLLDAGFGPEIVGINRGPSPLGLLESARPLMEHLGVDPERSARYLDAYQYIFKGTPLHPPAKEGAAPGDDRPLAEVDVAPLTFVCCVSDEAILEANLLSSPCLRPGSPHEMLLMPGCRSAAEGLNMGLALATNPLVVCVHQDVYLPRGWPERFGIQAAEAGRRWGRPGALGVYGVTAVDGRLGWHGHVVDRDVYHHVGGPLPTKVDALDEIVLALPRETSLGTDLCLSAHDRGLPVAVVDAPCYHNSLMTGLNDSYYSSAEAFRAKHRERLPVATPCAVISDGWPPRAPGREPAVKRAAKSLLRLGRWIRARILGRLP
jgi:hypothetical protein